MLFTSTCDVIASVPLVPRATISTILAYSATARLSIIITNSVLFRAKFIWFRRLKISGHDGPLRDETSCRVRRASHETSHPRGRASRKNGRPGNRPRRYTPGLFHFPMFLGSRTMLRPLRQPAFHLLTCFS